MFEYTYICLAIRLWLGEKSLFPFSHLTRYVGSFTSELAAATATDLFRLGISADSGDCSISLNFALGEHGKDADLIVARGTQVSRNPAKVVAHVREIVKRRFLTPDAKRGYFW